MYRRERQAKEQRRIVWVNRMNRRTVLTLGTISIALSACGYRGGPLTAGAGNASRVYKINGAQAQRIPFRMLDAINALRTARSNTPLVFNAALDAAALTHARDMSMQNRPWHFGSDGSSPLLRVQRVGYSGVFLGELISETYETELQTLSAWMKDVNTSSVLMDPNARDLGFAWYQESNGKIWWTLLTGG